MIQVKEIIFNDPDEYEPRGSISIKVNDKLSIEMLEY